MRKSMILVSLIVVTVMLGACNDNKSSTSESEDVKKTESVKTKGKLKKEDYEKLYSDPKKYKGFELEITGKVFAEPEKDEKGTYIQVWADPEKSEKNTLVAIDDPKFKIKTDDYVKIDGVIKDEFKGENAFGGTVTAPIVLAKHIEVVSYLTAVSPTLKDLQVDKEINQSGIKMTLKNIEIAENQTRVYVKIKNDTKEKVSFYPGSAKLIVGNKQLEEEYVDSETTGLQEIQNEILPSIETEGVIVYPAIDLSETQIKLNAEISSENYDLEIKPYIFDVSIN
ncbi:MULTISPECIES: DUF4352 domain-containing protein [unclassified Exiguobacterium]|uniref:DUF4352 domain-containing protein n=1 Tax=unclassified Exiguobacterium TaxID=2644629 RepID=UPI001BEBE39C|nr:MULTISPECIES: DUF4352 domain-containing protein [unclassified Exiguobacterium]